MIALLTDSASQMPLALADRLGVHVVPVSVTIDDVEYREGVDLTADDFYAKVGGSVALPTVTTSQPPASAFVAAFEERVAAGATHLLAVLVGSAYSGAVNSAEVAKRAITSRHPGVVISVVDSGTASFGISCAVWAAADVVNQRGSFEEAEAAAVERASRTGSVFMIDGTELAEQSGRFGAVDLGSAVPVLASGPDGLSVLGEVQTVVDGVDLMVDELLSRAPRIVAAIGRAAASTDPITDALVERLQGRAEVVELVEYRVGPSIAAHTGPNTVGGFSFPV